MQIRPDQKGSDSAHFALVRRHYFRRCGPLKETGVSRLSVVLRRKPYDNTVQPDTWMAGGYLDGRVKYKRRYPGNAKITKHSLLEASKKKERGTNNDKTKATYETIDEHTKKNCNRVTMERPVETLLAASGNLFKLFRKLTFANNHS